MRIFLFFLFILTITCITIIPAKIDQKKIGYEAYVADVDIGVPSRTYRLQISFLNDDIVLYTRLDMESTSYCEIGGGNDLLHLGSKVFRVPIVMDPLRKIRTDESYCEECVGIIGFGNGSVFWKLWPEITFTRDAIYLDSESPEFDENSKGVVSTIQCMEATVSAGICDFEGTIEVKGRFFKNVTISLHLTNENMVIPEDIYSTYTNRKNIYKGDAKNWQTLDIHYYSSHQVHNPTTRKLDFHIKPHQFVRHSFNGGKRFSIKKGEDNTVVLGTEFLKNFIVKKNLFKAEVVVKKVETSDTLSIANVILIAIELWLLVKWSITDLNKVFTRNQKWSVIFELVGIGIAIASYVMPSSLAILPGFLSLYIATGVMLGITLFFKIYSIYYSFVYFRRYTIEQKLESSHFTEINIMRSLTQEVLLLLAIWMLLVERRLELTSTSMVLIINVYLIYTLTFYIAFILVYSISKRDKEKSSSFFMFTILTVLVYIYQVLATINFFIRPLYIRNYQLYQNLIVPALVLLYMSIVALALYFARIYFSKSTAWTSQELKEKINK